MRVIAPLQKHDGISRDQQMTFHDRDTHEWPELIVLPRCAFPIALYFGKQLIGGRLPLYLANNSGSDLLTASVNSKGATVDGDDLIETGLGKNHFGSIPKGHGRLIEAYDVYFDGDFLIEYRIMASFVEGTRFHGRSIFKDIPASRWLRVEQWQPTSH